MEKLIEEIRKKLAMLKNEEEKVTKGINIFINLIKDKEYKTKLEKEIRRQQKIIEWNILFNMTDEIDKKMKKLEAEIKGKE